MNMSKGKWVWEEGQRAENGEWIVKPALVFTKGTAKHRSRPHSHASSVQGMATVAGARGTSPAARAAALFGEQQVDSEEGMVDENRLVTLEDVKAIAVEHISTSLLEKMKTSTVVEFDEFYRTDAMNRFLWTVLIYFDNFLMYNEASNDDNIKIPGALGEEARKALREARQKLTQAKVNLGKQYSELVTGQSHMSIHHSCQGRLRASKIHKDQHLYEIIYEFAMFVTWITFSYKHWNSIHKELGRLFKTTAFNRDVKVKGEGTVDVMDDMGIEMDTNSDEYLSYRVLYDRPPPGNLKELHSPALVGYFASPRQRHAWAFEPPYLPTRQRKLCLPTTESPPERLGVIGEMMSKLNPNTLRYNDEEEEEEEEEGEEEEKEEGEGEGGEEGEEERKKEGDDTVMSTNPAMDS